MNAASRYLKPRQTSVLEKLGDILIPVGGELPSFSQADVIQHVDRIFEFLPTADRSSLLALLTLLACTPTWLLATFWSLIQKCKTLSGFWGSPFRQIDIGLKGIIYTLYYSDLDTPGKNQKTILEILDWRTKMQTLERESEAAKQTSVFPLTQNDAIDINKIYAESSLAQEKIALLSLKERLDFISRLKDVILQSSENIITAIQKETSKSRTDCLMSEIFPAIDHLHYLEKYAEKVLQDENVPTPLVLMGKKSRIFYEPLGTILVISPWNYPFLLGLMPITSSFVVGNSVIFKPSEYTPLHGLLESLMQRAGFDRDWVQVIYGDGKVGQMLVEGGPQKIFFTGSTATGSKIMAEAAKSLIPVEMELGGKDAMIVFEDVNIKRTVRGALWGALSNSGQACTSVERLFVHETIYSEFKEALVREAEKVSQKVDSDGSADYGLMTHDAQVKIVAAHLDEAISLGAKLLTGNSWDRTSRAIPPLVLENVTKGMKIYQEETFGPIIPLFSFCDEAEVIARANETEYGLNASVWSKDIERAVRVSRRLVTGNVSINNVMVTEGNAHLPFGGAKKSGFGRYKGRFGLYTFANIKAVMIDKDSKKIEVNWYPYTPHKYRWFNTLMKSFFGKGVGSFMKFLLYGLWLEMYSTRVKRK
jgi:acyl-CoA reductase-like NAD-dependent aldehyde dehydrogenase